MSKFILLGDTHFGVRNDLSIFYSYSDKFYDLLFDYMHQHAINTIVQLGDLFDRRKYINFRTLQHAKQTFFDRLEQHGFIMHTLLGNHDIHYRESLEISSSALVLGEYTNINVYNEPATIDINGTLIDMIPWICVENKDAVLEFIANSKSDLCCGHFEIANFSMYRGVESHDGMSPSIFSKYEHVFSGHYHTRSTKENITYVGTPYEMTWQDYKDPKGFMIFDTETRQASFLQNPHTIFTRLEYDDTGKLPDLDGLDLKDCFIKLVVTSKTDLYKFDNFVQKLHNKGCYEIKILEDLNEFKDGEIDEEINLEDTMSVLSHYIDSIETNEDKEHIKLFMKNLYIEAVNSDMIA